MTGWDAERQSEIEAHYPSRCRSADLQRASDFYEDTAGQDVALRFLAAARATFREIAARPGAGSPRFGEELRLPHLRTRRIVRFPYVIFYVEHGAFIEVTRVLHERRDIRASYQDRA